MKDGILLLLNGDLRSPAAVRKLARRAGSVICVDGGARHAARLGLVPRIVIGDMDSLPARLPRWDSTVYICDFDPDSSDFEKALRFIDRRRFARAAKRLLGPAAGPVVWVAGFLGGRPDQELVNWAIFERESASMRLELADGCLAKIAGKGRHKVPCRKGQELTLLAVTPKARLTTRGLQYPLRKAELERGSRGLSNRAVSANASVEVHSGRVWIVLP